ncbi:MAG TPA: ABC transporter ATP-binding protein [Cyanobacteria bacterium UBA8803]|nr:ABC transporter ATP-binding protein [Cyanobacteria bacterium UBA9273]HBL58383.1 ABC transporter ATP-binding protein [Cyanobacteria bacterium UBA8803]
MEKKSLLSAEQIAWEFPSREILFKDIFLTLSEGDRVALVGPNGVGKSTLLKILAGQVQPTAGSIVRSGKIYYLPQVNTLNPVDQDDTILDFISSRSEEWWQVSYLLETKLETFLDLSLPVRSLSGGELTKLLLAVGLAREPSILLLDEPTNHLDFVALEQLKNILQEVAGAFAIVSHKPFFLEQVVNMTWELSTSGVKVYGGSFSSYREQKDTERQVALRSHEVAKKELKRVRDTALQEQKRAGKSRREGRKQAHEGGMGKAARDYFANRASATAGQAGKKHEAAIAKAKEKLDATKIRTNPATIVHLEEESHRKQRTLIDIQGADLKVGNQVLIKNIWFHLTSGERVAISGANGSGKSSLIQAILAIKDKEENQNQPNNAQLRTQLTNTYYPLPITNQTSLESGKVYLAPDLKVVCLDQRYGLVAREKTLLENLRTANPRLEYQLIRQQLGHFLFGNDEVNKKAEVLSGGELARLAISMITVSEIELLVVDEPTNNLDLETVAQIVAALKEFRGAILAISHDLDFLSKIGVTRAFNLKNLALHATVYLPDELEQYYQEVIGCG